MFNLKLKYAPSKMYTEDEDRFILIMLFKYGIEREDVYELIRTEIKKSPLFELNYSFRNKSSSDLSRRGNTLLQCVEKEFNKPLELSDALKDRLQKEDEAGKRIRDNILNDNEHENKKAKIE